MTAPSETVSMKLNTVYANFVLNTKTFAKSKKIHFSMLGQKEMKRHLEQINMCD